MEKNICYTARVGGGAFEGDRGMCGSGPFYFAVNYFTFSQKIDSQAVESYIITKYEQKEPFFAAWSLANHSPQCEIVEDQ